MIQLRRYRAEADRQIDEFVAHGIWVTETGIVDPRTGDAPETWKRTRELLIGRMMRPDTLNPWQRALL